MYVNVAIKKYSSLYRYLITGLITAFIYTFSLYVLLDFGFKIYISILSAYIINGIIRFFMHRYWVFKSTNLNLRNQILKYSLLMTSLYLFNSLFTYLANNYFALTNSVTALFSAIISTIIGYILSRYWVFRGWA